MICNSVFHLALEMYNPFIRGLRKFKNGWSNVRKKCKKRTSFKTRLVVLPLHPLSNQLTTHYLPIYYLFIINLFTTLPWPVWYVNDRKHGGVSLVNFYKKALNRSLLSLSNTCCSIQRTSFEVRLFYFKI